jgi:2-methylaconitate cis-trans-isomerase PrpF
VVCEVNEANRQGSTFTAHFVKDPPLDLTNSLMTGDTVTYLEYDKGVVPVSLVAVGNPYVFVDASEFAIRSTAELFADNPCLFRNLARIRRGAAELLGWDPAGAFPKIAVLGAFSSARLAVRAISVPGWHPALALTGLSCLAAATAIPGSIPHRLATATGCTPGHLVADTPGGTFRAAVRVEDQAAAGAIAWISIFDKSVRFTGDVLLADDDLAVAA